MNSVRHSTQAAPHAAAPVRHSTQAAPHAAAPVRQTGTAASDSPELVTSDDIPALRAIVEGTASSTGEEFFQNLVRHLAAALDVHYAFIAEFADGQHEGTIARLLVQRSYP